MVPIPIDGALLEGGGQVVRLSTSLSALLRKPIQIHSIRASRPKPGLAAQHLAGIQLVAAMCCGSLSGASIGATDVLLEPGVLSEDLDFTADAHTAGAVTLLLQSSLPVAFMRPGPPRTTCLILKGGTNVPWSPQAEYISGVLLPNLKRLFGLSADARLARRGLFPRGGGVLEVSVTQATPWPSFSVRERGAVTGVGGVVWACGAGSEKRVQEAAAEIRRVLGAAGGGLGGVEPKLETVAEGKAAGEGGGAVLWAHTECGLVIGGTGLESRGGKKGGGGGGGGSCGKQAAEELVRELEHGGCVDEYTQDQVVVFMSLSHEPCELRVGPLSMHTKTAIHFAQLLTGAEFSVTETEKGALLRCSGRPHPAAA